MNLIKIPALTAIALVLLGSACKRGEGPDFATAVKAEIKDENDLPVVNADVVLLFNHFQEGKTKKHEVKTDSNGIVTASDKIVASLMVKAAKSGFYPIDFDRVLIRMDVDSKKIGRLDLPLTMRRVKSPASLYAKKVKLPIPQEDHPVGFDFEVGDWVEPFGRGKFSDFMVSYSKKFTGYRFDEERLEKMRDFSKKAAAVNHEAWTEEVFKHDAGKWIGGLALSFPSPKEGIALVDKDYCLYSWLRMPHLAYETGYDTTWKREENTFSPRNDKDGIGYFLRTRVKLDEKGEIVSAHYAKLTSDIQFDPRGRVEFTYVFNPTPNDHNLEFNPHSNLFKNLKDDERVMFP